MIAMRCESTAATIEMKDGSPVRADRTPQNSPGQATYSRSCHMCVCVYDVKFCRRKCSPYLTIKIS